MAVSTSPEGPCTARQWVRSSAGRRLPASKIMHFLLAAGFSWRRFPGGDYRQTLKLLVYGIVIHRLLLLFGDERGANLFPEELRIGCTLPWARR